jgi:hypothetical protein
MTAWKRLRADLENDPAVQAEFVTLKQLEAQEQVAHSMRVIQDEITRLGTFGVAVSLDCEEGWIIGEYGPDASGEYGAPSIIARLPIWGS